MSSCSGPKSPQKQFALTVTGPGGSNWATTRAVGVPYFTVDGTWRLKFNILGTVDSASRTSLTITIDGITFAAVDQACTGYAGAGNPSLHPIIAAASANTIYIGHTTLNSTYYAASGDVELTSKPTWA
jgi:hypothetical protein